MASRCAFGNDRGVEQSVSLFINIITVFPLCISCYSHGENFIFFLVSNCGRQFSTEV